VVKALYGLRSSGACWHDHFADILHDLGFNKCRMKPDIWIRQQETYYNNIAVYVDDLAIASKIPSKIIKDLEEIHLLLAN
jgi:Reverse transcriptase (RNA-dependent DNA polymerase)